MPRVLGKCPKCKGMFISGKYGPYCKNKCGFHPGYVLGKKLNSTQIEAIINHGEARIDGIMSKTGKEYSVYAKMRDVYEYARKRPNGEIVTGFDFDLDLRFPDGTKITEEFKQEEFSNAG